jgi:hypothetical protein
MNSTSFHGINADKPLPAYKKALYLFLNYWNNSFAYRRLDPRLNIKDFDAKDFKKTWYKIPETSSPSRRLSDMFWMSLPWADIQENLGSIRILDTGCGSGKYGDNLTEWSGNRIHNYLGLDIEANKKWPALMKKHDFFKFKELRASEIFNHIPKDTNFFMTQSAIEHFDHDLTYFKHVNDYIQARKKPTVQVHIFPSQACLLLYLLHGVRQYTPRTISKITNLFDESSEATLFRLGGKHANKLHYDFVTKPLFFLRQGDLRNQKPKAYAKALQKAIRNDLKRPQKSPAFYALVIQSFFDQPLELT